MAQEWSTHYPLVDGHGNFGSVDGDGAAAMRYTEARLSKIAMEMLADINKDTVNFSPNFDETEKEPDVLPCRFPNLLCNGTTGIAVGMASNIPPHNIKETIDAVVKMINNRIDENRDTEIEELMSVIQGPDFPTGATIIGRRGIEEAYRTGKGKIIVRAVTNIEPMQNGKNRIVVTELPYGVNKAKLIEKIAELVKDKRVDGITDLADQSSREGMRISIELRRDVNPNVVLNQLMKHTQLQDTFGVIMLALVGGEPRILNIHDMLYYYLQHQEEVVTRRTRYDLSKAQERAHILEGLLIALDHQKLMTLELADGTHVGDASPAITPDEAEQIEVGVKYAGYISRQQGEIEKNLRNETTRIPSDLDYDSVHGLSFEVREKLKEYRPETIGQASRISGVTPAAISLLIIFLSKSKREREGANAE